MNKANSFVKRLERQNNMTILIYLKNVKKPLEIELSERKYEQLLIQLKTKDNKDLIEIGPITFLKGNYLYGIKKN